MSSDLEYFRDYVDRCCVPFEGGRDGNFIVFNTALGQVSITSLSSKDPCYGIYKARVRGTYLSGGAFKVARLWNNAWYYRTGSSIVFGSIVRACFNSTYTYCIRYLEYFLGSGEYRIIDRPIVRVVSSKGIVPYYECCRVSYDRSPLDITENSRGMPISFRVLVSGSVVADVRVVALSNGSVVGDVCCSGVGSTSLLD